MNKPQWKLHTDFVISNPDELVSLLTYNSTVARQEYYVLTWLSNL